MIRSRWSSATAGSQAAAPSDMKGFVAVCLAMVPEMVRFQACRADPSRIVL